MNHTAGENASRRQLKVPAVGEADNFSMDAIFLITERECGKCGYEELGIGGCDKVQAFLPDKKLHILQLKGGRISDAGLSVYSPGRSKKKKAKPIMSANAVVKGQCICRATTRMRRITITGTGLTLFGGGSSFV